MGQDNNVDYYPFPNDISLIGNNGERYPVPEKSRDWFEWMTKELIEKKICSEEILVERRELSPFFSTKENSVGYFGQNKIEYKYLHRIKTEPGHNYIYRVWLQFLYDEMVLGKRSPRVLRLASRGDEDANALQKWDELSEEISEFVSNSLQKHHDGYVLKDILLLSQNKRFNIFEDRDYNSYSLIDRIARRTVRALISDSKEKETTEWSVYEKMDKEDLYSWLEENSEKDEYKSDDFSKKTEIIITLIDKEIKPPNYDLIKKNSRCLPNPIFVNKMVNYIQSQLKQEIESHDIDFGEVVSIVPGMTMKIPEQMPAKIRRMFYDEKPQFGVLNIKGTNNPEWVKNSLDWRIRKGSEHLAYEILRILVCELKWITLEKGEHEDLEVHYSNDTSDKIKQTMKKESHIPTMIYFTEKLSDLIPSGYSEVRGQSPAFDIEKHGDEEHPLFRFMASSTKRWMYCEPEDHQPDSNGGFINPRSRLSILGSKGLEKLYNIKFRYAGKYIPESKEEWNENWPKRTEIGEDVCNALNYLQKTQWEVNLDLLEAITDGFKITHDRVEYGKGNNKIELKKFITEIFNSPEEEAAKLPKFRAKEIEAEIKIKKRDFESVLSSCFKAIRNGDNVFWHPWACDWRGRLYTINNTLSPQGGDFNKAIIRFKEWKPLGEQGWKWFKVHVCNLMSDLDFRDYFSNSENGLSWDEPNRYKKASFDSRADWTERNQKAILHICSNLENPEILETLEFTLDEILKPKGEAFQRLSVILEFRRIIEEVEDKKVSWADVKSGMPIHLDASCNGFQHAAALLENESLAKKVNLLKPDSADSKVNDLYGEIAEFAANEYKHGGRNFSELRKFVESYQDALGLDDEQIEQISEIFNRSLVKRPTIAVGYGASNLDNYLGIISGKEGAPPAEDNFRISDWKYTYGFDEKDEKEYSKMGVTKPKPNHNESLKGWLDKHRPGEDYSKWNRKKLTNKLIEYKINSPKKHQCEKCKLNKETMTGLLSHIRSVHKVQVWHPESPLYKSALKYITDKIDDRSWPSKLQLKFATATAKDIMKAIIEVTDDSFGEIGKERIWKIQSKLIKKQKLLSWNVLDKNGVSINHYKPQKGKPSLIKDSPKDVVKREKLISAYAFLYPNKSDDWDEILAEENIEAKPYASLAKKLLKELMVKVDNGSYSSKLPEAKEFIDNLFKIGFTIRTNRDEKIHVDSEGCISGSIANFVHSLDAAHMRNVINSMAKSGIESFWSVHDSFGTHAADIGKMREIIKTEFVNLHEGKNINWWCKHMYLESNQEDIDGTLNLDDVLESQFLVG